MLQISVKADGFFLNGLPMLLQLLLAIADGF